MSKLCCRICLEDGARSEFIAPCACSGSSRWVHRNCLNRWRSTREDVAFSQCTVCRAAYSLVPKAGKITKWSQNLRFFCLVLRDLFLAAIASQMAVGILSLSVYLFGGKSILSYFLPYLSPLAFYYLAGLVLLLAIIGMLFTTSSGCGSEPTCWPICGGPINNDPLCWWCWMDNISYGNPQFYCYDPHCCCCCCQNTVTDGPCICPAITCDTCTCGECGAGASECTCCADAGQEAIICLLAVLVIFAIIGVFVSIVLGLFYCNFVVQRHIHVLQKWNLAQDYLVADLLPEDFVDPESEAEEAIEECMLEEGHRNEKQCGGGYSVEFEKEETLLSDCTGIDRSWLTQAPPAVTKSSNFEVMSMDRGELPSTTTTTTTTRGAMSFRLSGPSRRPNRRPHNEYSLANSDLPEDTDGSVQLDSAFSPSAPQLSENQVKELRSLGLME